MQKRIFGCNADSVARDQPAYPRSQWVATLETTGQCTSLHRKQRSTGWSGAALFAYIWMLFAWCVIYYSTWWRLVDNVSAEPSVRLYRLIRDCTFSVMSRDISVKILNNLYCKDLIPLKPVLLPSYFLTCCRHPLSRVICGKCSSRSACAPMHSDLRVTIDEWI